MRTWTEADFENLGWHDNHVHAFALQMREHGCADLVFDIDFITAWQKTADTAFLFQVAPATLIFHDAFDLALDLDYATVGAGMVPFSIAGIFAEGNADSPDDPTFRFTIPINWPEGSIRFRAPRFTQTLRADPVATTQQFLEAHQRQPLIGVA